jgi:hypothetical protein
MKMWTRKHTFHHKENKYGSMKWGKGKQTTKTMYIMYKSIQDEHKITLHFQNGTENKCSKLRISHQQQLIENFQTLFQIIFVIVAVAHLCQMMLVLEMATPEHRSWCALQLVKNESVTAGQRAFRTQFHTEPPSQVSIYEIFVGVETANHNCHSFHH